jgi:hypothetical protein
MTKGANTKMKRLAILAVLLLVAGVALFAQSGHAVSLSWTNPVDFVSGDSFNVYRGTVSGGPYVKVNTAAITGNAFVDATLPGAGTFYYVATHVQGNAESLNSNEVKAVVLPSSPTSLVVTGVK